MAISKKEAEAHKKEVDALKLRVALCWTPEITPDVLPPVNSSNAMTVGWLTSHDNVDPGCSSACYHGRGRITETSTQGPRSLFSTRLRALQAVRHEMELRYAAELKRIDTWIELEKQNPTPLPEK